MSITLNKELENKIREVIAQWTTVPIVKIEQLDPDASARLYTRVAFSDTVVADKRSVLVMFFENTRGPEVGSGLKIGADAAYVELSSFFSRHLVPVPQLYIDARDQQFLVIEDCGTLHLADAIAAAPKVQRKQLLANAVEILLQIQRIKPERALAFDREFSAVVFEKEMFEFPEYFLSQYVKRQDAIEQSEEYFAWLAQHVASSPQTVVHRDYHGWNILVEGQQRLRVIDFQDALIGPRCYDIASLLFDRDSDQLIGKDVVDAVANSFLQKISAPRAELLTVLLQRDLKVAGRFAKLVALGKPRYGQWIAGTVKRIFASLEELASDAEVGPRSKQYLSYLKQIEGKW